ncbi:MAG: hypothetical protein H5U02_14500 [Clostridia bacterium]|nr:hypothetical protein [Clostridia bacterium]
MPTFSSTDELYRVIGQFIEMAGQPQTMESLRQRWGSSPEFEESEEDLQLINKIGEDIRKGGLCTRFVFHDPEGEITVDARDPSAGKFYDVYYGPPPVTPDLTVETSGDTSHLFWLGKVNVVTAMARRQIKMQGPVTKGLKMLPVLSQAFKLYPKYLRYEGLHHFLNVK